MCCCDLLSVFINTMIASSTHQISAAKPESPNPEVREAVDFSSKRRSPMVKEIRGAAKMP
jgi:hypothetical protein